jgi:hypothetical protein
MEAILDSLQEMLLQVQQIQVEVEAEVYQISLVHQHLQQVEQAVRVW